MKTRLLLFCSVFFIVFFSSTAQASSHVLTVRQLPGGEYEAVVTYNNQDYCFFNVYPPSSIQVIEYDVFITAPGPEIITCIGKAPPMIQYEQTAIIGELAHGKYTVTWNQDRSFSLTTTFEAEGYSSIPSSSLWSLLLLALGVLTIAHFRLRARRSTAPK